MPAIAGNAWTLAVGIQTAQGTPLLVPHMKMRYTGGFGPNPVRNFLTLAETDASRMEGDRVVVGLRVEGESEHYLREEEFHRVAHLLLGTTASTGAGPNYTHTSSSTASGTAAFATLFKALNTSALVDRYTDCQIGAVTIRGGTEQAITYTSSWLGLSALMNSTDPGTPVPPTSAPLVYPHVTVTKAASAAALVQSFELTITQNRTLLLADTGLSAGAVVAGLFSVTGNMAIVFENDDDYNIFQTGSAVGTAPGTTILSEALNIAIVSGTNNSVTLDMDNIVTTAYPLAGNVDGAPLTVALEFYSKRGAALSNVLEIITKNQFATVTT